MNCKIAFFLSFAFLLCQSARAEEVSAVTNLIPLPNLDELTFLSTGDPRRDWSSTRQWTSADGRHMQATIVEAYDYGIRVRLQSGKEQVLTLSKFSEDDQRFIQEWREMSRFFKLDFQPGHLIPTATDYDIDAVGIPSFGNRHETKHFRIESKVNLHAALLRDISLVLEATYHAVDYNPFGLAITVPSSEKILVRLFATMEQYHAAGAPVGTGGAYHRKSRQILVPLPQAGYFGGTVKEAFAGGVLQERRSENWVRNMGSLDPGVIIHEITHALTHDWLAIGPYWFVEGFAEYMGSMPYANGALDSSGIKAKTLERMPRMFGGDIRRIRFHTPAQIATMSPGVFRAQKDYVEPTVLLATYSDYDFENPPAEFFALPRMPETPFSDFANNLSREELAQFTSMNYASSMALLYYFVLSGQIEPMRRYLFDFLHFEWERHRYLTEYDEATATYRDLIMTTGTNFQKEVDAYNAALSERSGVAENAGPDDSAPLSMPILPATITAPAILKIPRNPASLSKAGLREASLKKHLQLPSTLSLSTFQ